MAARLDAIADQTQPVVVAVCVAEGEKADETTANIIGGSTPAGKYTGMKALLDSQTRLKVKPRILALRQIGWTKISGVMLRFAGAIQHEDSEEYDAVEIVVRGRHKELDRGEYKQGENSSTKISTLCTYYKESVNGETIIEIDTVNFIENIDGKDRIAGAHQAIGL